MPDDGRRRAGQIEERRGLLLPHSQQAATPLRPIARCTLRRMQRAGGHRAQHGRRQQGQAERVRIGRCSQLQGCFRFGEKFLLPAPVRQAAQVGCIAGLQSARFPAEIVCGEAISRPSHRAAKHGGRQPETAQSQPTRHFHFSRTGVCRTGQEYLLKFSMGLWAGKTNPPTITVYNKLVSIDLQPKGPRIWPKTTIPPTRLPRPRPNRRAARRLPYRPA